MQSVTCKEDTHELKVNRKRHIKPFDIRIDNLSENMTRFDIDKLVKPFGPIRKRYLATKRGSGLCRGFAFVNFMYKRHAQEAINALNGYTYDNLTLTVDWSKASEVSNVHKHNWLKLFLSHHVQQVRLSTYL